MKKLIAILAMAMFIIGCAGSGTPESRASLLVEMQQLKASYNKAGTPAGMGIGESSDESVAYKMADAEAREDLAKILGTHIKGLEEHFVEQVASNDPGKHFQDAVKNKFEAYLSGAAMKDVKVETYKKGDRDMFKVYGIVTIDGNLIENYIKAIKDSGQLSEEAANKIRAAAKEAYAEIQF